MNQKGFSQPIIVLGIIILVLVIGGVYYSSQQQKQQIVDSSKSTQQPTPSSIPSITSQEEIIDKSTSPDNSYVVIKSRLGDQLKLTIQDKNGNTTTEDVIDINNEVIKSNLARLGLKGSGMVGYSVKDWRNSSMFILQITPANGEEYEVNVDASTGKVDESSFNKIK